MEGSEVTSVVELRAELDRARERVQDLEAALARHEAGAAQHARQLEHYAADLRDTFKQERSRSRELRRSYRQTVRALANAVEARDAYTGGHAERVAAYGLAIARAVGMDPADSEGIEFGFLLHDIGKVAVPDAILFKPGPLDDEELAVMRRHPLAGWEMLREVEFLGEARLIVRHHHERWDGAGYPDGLAGEDIPLAARVFAIADTLDALTSERPYRGASDWRLARNVIRAGAGTQFCPRAVEAYEGMGDATFEELRRMTG